MRFFEPAVYVEELTLAIFQEVPQELQGILLESQPLREALLGLKEDVERGLKEIVAGGPSSVDDFDARLKSRKRAIIQAAPTGHVTLEKIVASVCRHVIACAKALK